MNARKPHAPSPASYKLGTIGQLAVALHVHKGTCWRWLAGAEAGGIPHPKAGTALPFNPEVVDRLLAKWATEGGQAHA
jgi:hypothetical protein